MIVEIVIFATIVMIVGLVSTSLVTGMPLGKSFRNTQMMGVLFCTGVLLGLIAYTTVATQTKKCTCQQTGASKVCTCYM